MVINPCISTYYNKKVPVFLKNGGHFSLRILFFPLYREINLIHAWVAQLVEQRTENPCVGGSSPPLGTIALLNVMLKPPIKECIEQAARLLNTEGLVIFPTETVYGLGGIATSDTVAHKIFHEKNRPSYNPLIVHVRDWKQAEQFGVFSEDLRRLAHLFWPGPLTVVAPVREGTGLSSVALAHLKTVALRCPDHPVTAALLRATHAPLVAPSANLSGRVSSTTAAHAQKYFPHIPVLDGGECQKGLESTVVRCDKGIITILRSGAISAEALEEKTGLPTRYVQPTEKISSPGQTDKHYAPTLRLRMDVRTPLKGEAFLGFGRMNEGAALNLSPYGSLEEAARNLYAFLHTLDNPQRYTGIAVAPIPNRDLGISINDRLRRATKSSLS